MSQLLHRLLSIDLLITVNFLSLINAFQILNPQFSISKHAPILQVTSTKGYIRETSEIGTIVRVSPNNQADPLQILISDEDLHPGMPAATYQYILTGTGATVFGIDQRGYLYLNVPHIDADPPNPSTYQLNIQAREVDTVPIRTSETTTILIHVIDVNDNSPQFEKFIYNVNVSTFGGYRPVVRVRATDVDSGIFGVITYRIAQVTSGAEGKFYYDTKTNTLYVNGDLIEGERYQVVIEATDGGGRTSQAIVIVTALQKSFPLNPQLSEVERLRQNSLTFITPAPTSQTNDEQEEAIQTFVTEVTENTPINTLIVSLGSEYLSKDVYFTIVDGNDEKKFAINEQTGVITTVDEFDREQTSIYSLQIDTRSRYPDQHLYWTIVQISVLDVNDNSPHFIGTQPIRLMHNVNNLDQLTSNMVVGKITVEDPDDEDNGRLELRVEPNMNRLFTVSNDGVVSINGDFTAEHFGEHRMFIIARDHGDPPRESKAEVIVNIFGTLITVATGAPTNEDFEYVNSAEETSIRPDFNLPTITTSSSDRIGHSFTSFTSSLPGQMNGLVPAGQITHANQGLGIPWTFPGTLPTKSTGRGTFGLPTLTTNNNNTFNPFMPSSFTVAPPLFRLAPVFNPPKITVTVNENESNVEITKVHATYPDGEPGTITYILQKGDPTLFEVSPYSGAVTLLRPLDAESDTSYTLQISTKEASALAVDRLLAHFVLVTIHVGDVNDWIPKFENSNYNFNIHEGTTPGTIVGQVVAVDEDKENPNNRIRYRLLTAGGLENYFAVNSETGLITLAKDIDEFAGEKITLRIEASDSGIPAQSSITNVLFDIIPNTLTVTPSFIPYPSQPIKKTIQFTSRNYSVSVAESVRPPNLVHVLSIKNKPTDTRFISCNIVSGNHRGAFSVMAGTDGDCELRTQVELDRESMERYLLNITVTAGDQSDNTLVSITVVDVNDNAPRFIYNNDVGMRVYFAGISSTADASTKVLTVKAEDDDVGNNSLITYSIDPLSLHSKYFTVSPAGEISTTQSISDLPLKNQIDYFEIRVSACDSPISGQQLCSKAYVVINVITESNRFRITAVGLNPQQLQAHENEIIKILRDFMGSCTLLSVENAVEQPSSNNQIRTDMYMYAVDPDTKKICKKNEFRKLFESSSMAVVANKAQPWLQIEKIDEIVNEGTDDDEETLSNSWKTASILLIGFAALIAVGSLVGLCVVCLYWNRLKSTQRTVHSFNPHGRPQKLSTIFLPNAPSNTRFDKIYETQILEMPISDEDVTKNGTVVSGKSRSGVNGYSNYGRNGSLTYEGDFSIEENMYALNTPGRIDPVTKRVQNLVIPAPDYPRTNRQANSHQKKSLL